MCVIWCGRYLNIIWLFSHMCVYLISPTLWGPNAHKDIILVLMRKQACKSQNYLFFSAESVVWGVGLANRKYSLYSIKTIRSRECPHKTWKPNVCVCDLECAEVGMKILWYNVDTPSQKWATAACRRSWFQDSHTHAHAHKIHSQWYLVLCNNIKTVTPVSPVLCEERFLILHIGLADLRMNSVEPSWIPFEWVCVCVCVCVSVHVCVCLCGPWPPPPGPSPLLWRVAL